MALPRRAASVLRLGRGIIVAPHRRDACPRLLRLSTAAATSSDGVDGTIEPSSRRHRPRSPPSSSPSDVTITTTTTDDAALGQADRTYRRLVLGREALGGADAFAASVAIERYCRPDDTNGGAVSRDHASRASALLRRLLDESRSGDRTSSDNTVVVTADDVFRTVDAWRRAGDASEAESILLDAASAATAPSGVVAGGGGGGGNARVSVNHISYNAAIDAHAKAGDPRAAEALLRQMMPPDDPTTNVATEPKTGEENSRQMETMLCRPDATSFNSTVDAWAKSHLPNAGAEAERILREMQLRSDAGNVEVRPNSFTYASCIHAYAGEAHEHHSAGRADDAVSAARHGERLLNELRSKYEASGRIDVSLEPNAVVLTAVVDGWAKSGSEEASDRAEAILSELLNAGRGNFVNAASATAMINAYAVKGDVASAERAEHLLERLERAHYEAEGRKSVSPSNDTEADDELSKPNLITYNATIKAWSKTEATGSAKRAEQILDRMWELHHTTGDDDVRPDTATYSSVLDAYAKSLDSGRGQNAQRILDDMLRRCNDAGESGGGGVRPDVFCYAATINAWSKDGGPNAARRAEAILESMMHRHAEGDDDIRPNAVCFNSVLNAWSKSGEKYASRKAEEIVEKMWRCADAGFDDAKPSIVTYSNLIDAYSRSRDRGAAGKAEETLRSMQRLSEEGHAELKPNTYVYNSCIAAYAQSSDRNSVDRAEALLQEMLSQSEAGDESVKPNTISFNVVLDCLSKKQSQKGAAKRAEALLQTMQDMHAVGGANTKPDAISYTSVISAWAKSNEKVAAKRAEAILSHMQALFEKGVTDVRPNTVTFTSVVHAWAQSSEPDAARRAEDILNHMEALYKNGNKAARPNSVTFNTVINAYARSGDKGAWKHVDPLLQRMRDLRDAGVEECKPNLITYNSVLNCYGKSSESDALQRAESILQEMIDGSNSGDGDVAPDKVTYTSFLTVLARSRYQHKAQRAKDILLDMISRSSNGDKRVEPNIVAFDTVIRSCAFSTMHTNETKRAALRIALEVLEMTRTSASVSPGAYTYDTLFLACSNLSSGDEYARLVERAFLFCCEDGVLSDRILRNLRKQAPLDVFRRMIGTDTGSVTVHDLPPEWSKNTVRTAVNMGRSRQGPNSRDSLRKMRKIRT